MISANDAAIALAQATGSYAKGMAMINAEAHHLQADDTVAVTAERPRRPGQHVSAYDEALFARQALAVPEFMQDETLRIVPLPAPAAREAHHRHNLITLWTQNTMLYTYRGDLGGKIGWTTPAGATFIGWARRGGTPPGGDHPALQAADRADLRGAPAELGFRHGREGQAGRATGQPAARVTAHPRPASARPATQAGRRWPSPSSRTAGRPARRGPAARCCSRPAGGWAIVRVSRRGNGRAGSPPGH